MKQHLSEVIMPEAAKHVPGIGVGGSWLASIPLPEIVLLITAAYYLLLIGLKVYDRFYKPWREKRVTASK